MDAACRILFEIFMLKVKDFPTRASFLSGFDAKIDDYNQTNIDALPNSIKLQCLRLCIMQDTTLYNAYTSYLTTQRTTKGHA